MGAFASSNMLCAHNPSATNNLYLFGAVLCWMCSTCLTAGCCNPIGCKSTVFSLPHRVQATFTTLRSLRWSANHPWDTRIARLSRLVGRLAVAVAGSGNISHRFGRLKFPDVGQGAGIESVGRVSRGWSVAD